MKTLRSRWAHLLPVAGFVVALMLGPSPPASGAERKAREENKAFMRMKLAWSDAVLEGLTLDKLDQVSRNALRLRDLTHSNLWYSMRQPEYMRHTTNFQNSAQALYAAAVDKDLAAATEAYSKVTRSCVDCHRLVRVEQRRLGTPAPAAKTSSPVGERPRP